VLLFKWPSILESLPFFPPTVWSEFQVPSPHFFFFSGEQVVFTSRFLVRPSLSWLELPLFPFFLSFAWLISRPPPPRQCPLLVQDVFLKFLSGRPALPLAPTGLVRKPLFRFVWSFSLLASWVLPHPCSQFSALCILLIGFFPKWSLACIRLPSLFLFCLRPNSLPCFFFFAVSAAGAFFSPAYSFPASDHHVGGGLPRLALPFRIFCPLCLSKGPILFLTVFGVLVFRLASPPFPPLLEARLPYPFYSFCGPDS